jgi:hypothetical protein
MTAAVASALGALNGGRLAFAQRRRPSSIHAGVAASSVPASRHSPAAWRASGSSSSPSDVPPNIPATSASRLARPDRRRYRTASCLHSVYTSGGVRSSPATGERGTTPRRGGHRGRAAGTCRCQPHSRDHADSAARAGSSPASCGCPGIGQGRGYLGGMTRAPNPFTCSLCSSVGFQCPTDACTVVTACEWRQQAVGGVGRADESAESPQQTRNGPLLTNVSQPRPTICFRSSGSMSAES